MTFSTAVTPTRESESCSAGSWLWTSSTAISVVRYSSIQASIDARLPAPTLKRRPGAPKVFPRRHANSVLQSRQAHRAQPPAEHRLRTLIARPRAVQTAKVEKTFHTHIRRQGPPPLHEAPEGFASI